MTATEPRRTRGPRWRRVELGRAGWGLALLVAPRPVLTRVHHVRVDRAALVVARILGARQLAQALLSGVRPGPEVLAMGVWVDGAHAATAVALAAADRSRARAALTDAAVATAWALAGARDLRRGPVPPPAHDRRRDALARQVLRLVPGGTPLLRQADRDRAATARAG